MNLLHGNCLELMKDIKSGSVDAIICDPPYGTTACKWDSVIPFDLMWEQLNRVIKPNGAIVLFGSEPFSSALRMSNIKNYKYDWIWKKNRSANFIQANYQPLKKHEIISVFSFSPCSYTKKGIKSSYFPIMSGMASINKGQSSETCGDVVATKNSINYTIKSTNKTGKMFPNSILDFKADTNKKHPTQKPIALMEYLIKTYTNENETVLDFTMGSGSTGVACKNLNRNFIGIEMDDKYFEIAKNRINSHNPQIELF
jgi:site-specific DNA-methyltransferase (adenine-specific)